MRNLPSGRLNIAQCRGGVPVGTSVYQETKSLQSYNRHLCSANLMVLSSRLPFMPLSFRVDIRDADHPGQSSLRLVGHTEFGDLKFPAPECLLMVQVCPAPRRNAGGPCCNESPIP